MAKPDTSTENTFCHTHSFHTDPVEVKHMEKSLLRLLHDFNSCKSRLRGYSLDQMEHIRNQQESLARLHFELASKGECFSPLSENGIRVANENMDKTNVKARNIIRVHRRFEPKKSVIMGVMGNKRKYNL
ncbi:unnamed protein product [Lepeophtheirus salmonis]|uniref:(salmon louse) hypothetical protein n=1 Tax=Lepeophtheirus salmonis TaxID=72036 RepID=A0A7R8HAJ9_LEPSM|nr:unnamed protein product [Lepeophtheirus salmonis]CAF2972061.1 unnamed protein product [Lepeophtheirus salmonis]